MIVFQLKICKWRMDPMSLLITNLFFTKSYYQKPAWCDTATDEPKWHFEQKELQQLSPYFEWKYVKH